MSNEFPKRYVVQGDNVTVTTDLHDALNELAGRFYEALGYKHVFGLDYASSQHPMENKVYAMALEAYYFQIQTGGFDE